MLLRFQIHYSDMYLGFFSAFGPITTFADKHLSLHMTLSTLVTTGLGNLV